MGELSEIYGFDKEIAQTVGILHDAGKDLPTEEIEELLKVGNIQIAHECETNYVLYLHGPVGACFVQKELGITDELILDAIRTHTFYGTSKHFDDPIAWCVRFSDILEPTRNWEHERVMAICCKNLRELVYSGKMKDGAYLQTGCLIKWFEEKGMPVHPTTRKIKQELQIALSLDDSFLRLDSEI